MATTNKDTCKHENRRIVSSSPDNTQWEYWCPDCDTYWHEPKSRQVVFIVEAPNHPDVAVVVKRLNGDLHVGGHVLLRCMQGRRVRVTVRLEDDKED